MSKAYLVLQNGQVFTADRFGADGEVVAELVFTTGMVGYLETLTDPSYQGQMVVQTFPLIGNYGVIPADFESPSPRLSAYIVRQVCNQPSNFRSEQDLNSYLSAAGVVGLCNIDTRALTRIIREYGVMNAAILDHLPDDLAGFTRDLAERALSSNVYQVSCEKIEPLCEGVPHVVLWDFGHKDAMYRELKRRGCRVTAVPAGCTAQEIIALNPDGVLLSNGPGDPAVNTEIIAQLRELLKHQQLPVMGICLGHQLLALAMGAKSVKLKYGHRGANQPVRDLKTGRLYITSQNHGYAIVPESLPEHARVSFENANDHTCEGIEYTDRPAFSVQFHPEACSGPKDPQYLFDQFISMMEVGAHAAGK